MTDNYQTPPASFQPPQPEAPQNEPPQAVYTKAKPPEKKASSMKIIMSLLALVVFFGIGLAGVLISQRQYISEGPVEPVAPNVPQSEPKAAVQQQTSCKITFTVPEVIEPLECGETPCDTDDECDGSLVCITADDGENYCGKEEYETACADNPTTANCCEAPDDELACAEQGCDTNDDCAGGLICVTADNGNNYCAKTQYQTACEDNPSEGSCCEAPVTSTPTPTPTPTSTPTLIASASAQPDLPEELPQSGPAEWLKYLQGGLAALGIGALLLLLL